MKSQADIYSFADTDAGRELLSHMTQSLKANGNTVTASMVTVGITRYWELASVPPAKPSRASRFDTAGMPLSTAEWVHNRQIAAKEAPLEPFTGGLCALGWPQNEV